MDSAPARYLGWHHECTLLLSFDLGDHVLCWNDMLQSLVIVGPLGIYLIFNVDAGNVGRLRLADGPRHMHGIAEARAAIDL